MALDTLESLLKASQLLERWNPEAEAELLTQLQKHIGSMPDKVLEGSIEPLRDAFQGYHRSMVMRRVLLASLKTKVVCPKLVYEYLAHVLETANQLVGFELPDTGNFENSLAGHRNLLIELLGRVNANLLVHWIQVHGYVTEGQYKLPEYPDDYTPISGYEACQDQELLGLINQYIALSVALEQGDNSLLEALSNFFSQIRSNIEAFIQAWSTNPGVAAIGTIDGLLEGLGIYTLIDGVTFALELIPSVARSGNLPVFGEMRTRAADNFWNIVELFGVSDIRENPAFQDARLGGDFGGKLVSAFNLVKGAYNFTSGMVSLVDDLGRGLGGGAISSASGTGGAAVLTWGTVAAQADTIPWEAGAQALLGALGYIEAFAQKGQRDYPCPFPPEDEVMEEIYKRIGRKFNLYEGEISVELTQGPDVLHSPDLNLGDSPSVARYYYRVRDAFGTFVRNMSVNWDRENCLFGIIKESSDQDIPPNE